MWTLSGEKNMKLFVCGFLVMGFCVANQAKAETQLIKKAGQNQSDLAFMNDYDAKIAALDGQYTVSYVSAKERARALKNQPANGVDVKLVKKARGSHS
jgi:hypothetical protein